MSTSLSHLVDAILLWRLRSCDHACQVGVSLTVQSGHVGFSLLAVSLFLRAAITLGLFPLPFFRSRMAHGHLRGSHGSDVYQADGT